MCPKNKKEKRKERTGKVKISQQSGISERFLMYSFHQNLGAGGQSSVGPCMWFCTGAAVRSLGCDLAALSFQWRSSRLLFQDFPQKEEVAGYAQ